MDTGLLIPRQPYHMLLTEQYTKKIVLEYGISHFYECRVSNGVSEIKTSVPDGCIDVMFYWSTDYRKMGADVIGTLLQPHAVKVHSGYHYFGVRFLPGQRFLFDDTPFSEMVEHAIPLQDQPENHALIEKIAMAADFESRIAAFMAYYLPKYLADKSNAVMDGISHHMLQEILNRRGNVKISELAESMGYSERYTSRMFAEKTGIAPKKFCRIIRFQNALQEIEEKCIDHYELCDISEIGYYDEAHFIHDFKTFSGQSPVKFVNDLKQERMMERLKIL